MDVLRTDDEREDAENRRRAVQSDQSEGDLDPKDYTVTEIMDMDLTREQLQSLLDQENASDKPRVSLIEYLEQELERGSS